MKTKPTVKTQYLKGDKTPTFVERLMKSCGSAALAVASFVALGIVIVDGSPKIYVAYLEGLGAKLAAKLHINITAPENFVGVASIATSNGVSIVEAPPGFFDSPLANRIVGAVLDTLVSKLGTSGGTLMLNVPSGQDISEAYVSADGTTWHRAASGTKPVSCMRFVPNTRYAIAIGSNGELLMIDIGDKNLLAGKRTAWSVLGRPFGDVESVAFLSRVKPDGTVIATGEHGAKATFKIETEAGKATLIGKIDTSSPNTVAIAALDFDPDAAIRAQTGIAQALRGRAPTAIALDYLPPTADQASTATA